MGRTQFVFHLQVALVVVVVVVVVAIVVVLVVDMYLAIGDWLVVFQMFLKPHCTRET